MTTERNIQSIYEKIAIEKLNFLKGQLQYVNEALTWPLEQWERKEYLGLKDDYIKRIQDQESHIKRNF